MNQIHKIAQGLASLGRGEDKVLIHMTPGEVHGLQKLAVMHGGSLTINPHTGLPEAGFLSDLLPTIVAGIGVALAPFTGGASLALGAALGAGTAAIQGKKGWELLAGGLGGMGGASLAGALSKVGTAAGAGAGAAANAGGNAVANSAGILAPATAADIGSPLILGTGGAGAAGAASAVAPTLSGIGQGLGALVKNPSTIMPQLAAQGAGRMALAGAAAPMLYGASKQPEYKGPDKTPPNYRRYAYHPGTPEHPSSYEFLGQGPDAFPPPPVQPNPSIGPTMYNPAYGMAGGGLTAFTGGGFTQGMGDGMSDSIPASINGSQEARLADGEFVVPADVVSHLGNGSSKSGAQQLYAMMDQIRRDRTGRASQSPQIDPREYLPS